MKWIPRPLQWNHLSNQDIPHLYNWGQIMKSSTVVYKATYGLLFDLSQWCQVLLYRIGRIFQGIHISLISRLWMHSWKIDLWKVKAWSCACMDWTTICEIQIIILKFVKYKSIRTCTCIWYGILFNKIVISYCFEFMLLFFLFYISSLEFEIPMYMCSGMQIRFLKVFEKGKPSITPHRWVRYITHSDSYVFRV